MNRVDFIKSLAHAIAALNATAPAVLICSDRVLTPRLSKADALTATFAEAMSVTPPRGFGIRPYEWLQAVFRTNPHLHVRAQKLAASIPQHKMERIFKRAIAAAEEANRIADAIEHSGNLQPTIDFLMQIGPDELMFTVPHGLRLTASDLHVLAVGKMDLRLATVAEFLAPA
jgi:hypothetical protein